MHYRQYGKLGYEVSALGMGCMRLPRIYQEGKDTAEVDYEKATELIRCAVKNGINYFDTAFTYHNGDSETALGRALDGGYRQKVRIVTKQQIISAPTNDDTRRNLETTLTKLRTDHIDVYLIHNIHAATWNRIKERKLFHEYEKFRQEGMIGAIGFSFHGDFELFSDVLNEYPWEMCQIQQNILDTDREATESAIHLAGEKGVALVLMEPLRGGGLVKPAPSIQAIYDAHAVSRKPIEWAFRHCLQYKEVSTVLSGVTNIEQLLEDIDIFSKEDATPGCITESDRAMLKRVKAEYEGLAAVPCTACEYCLPCPNRVSIPSIFYRYNEGVMCGSFEQPKRMYMFLTKANRQASNCVKCGQCEEKCPQKIEIMKHLELAHEKLKGWVE